MRSPHQYLMFFFFIEDSNLDSRRNEIPREQVPARIEQPPPPVAESPVPVVAPPTTESETSREGSVAQKRPAEEVAESQIDSKRPKAEVAPVLEDDLSEISDDADEILNRAEVGIYIYRF